MLRSTKHVGQGSRLQDLEWQIGKGDESCSSPDWAPSCGRYLGALYLSGDVEDSALSTAWLCDHVMQCCKGGDVQKTGRPIRSADWWSIVGVEEEI